MGEFFQGGSGMTLQELAEKCFNEFCGIVGDTPCGCDACPYGEYGSEDGACYKAYLKDKGIEE